VRLGATVLFLGALVAGVSLAVAGAFGQERTATAAIVAAEPGTIPGVSDGDVSTVEALDLVAGVGLAVMVFGGLLVGLALLTRRRADGPGDDPWAGHTLEWATTSPPPVGHFAELPEISSEAPVYDARHAAAGTDTTEASA
jgi:heme/copper-type cytochrome/quinol oxidase subunit 1